MKHKSKRTLTPKLRFREFRGGEGWQTPQLSDLYGFKRTNTLSRDKLNYESGTIRNIHYGDIHTKFKPLFRVDHECVPFVNTEISADAFMEKDDCEEGDIVLADASEDLNDIGKAIEIISLDGQRVVAGTHTIHASRHGSVPIVGFGGHLFQSAAVRAGIQRESQGAKVYGISANRISPVALPLPPTNQEQKQIADCLSSLDQLIAAEGRKLEALRDHKRGLMQQLFPQPGETQPRMRFPEFRDKREWKQAKIGDHVDLLSGYPFNGKDIVQDEGGVRLMRGINITEGMIRHSADFDRYYTGPLDDVQRYMLKKNDLVIGMDGSKVGKNSALITKMDADALLVQRVARLRCQHSTTIRFLAHVINSTAFHRYVDRINTSSGIPHISAKQIKDFPIPLPSITEQRRIADCLTALDTRIAGQANKIESLKTHKRGLLQQLFPAPEEH